MGDENDENRPQGDHVAKRGDDPREDPTGDRPGGRAGTGPSRPPRR